jgi:hypothetical protein
MISDGEKFYKIFLNLNEMYHSIVEIFFISNHLCVLK